MKVDDIIKAQHLCFIESNRESYGYCKSCPLYELDTIDENCQVTLAKLTIEKLELMRGLLDDKVNHHYYDTLEFYQEENEQLRNKLEKIREIVEKHTN